MAVGATHGRVHPESALMLFSLGSHLCVGGARHRITCSACLRLINFAHGDFITFGAYAASSYRRAIDVATMARRRLAGGTPGSRRSARSWWAGGSAVGRLRLPSAARQQSAPTLMVASFSLGYIIQNAILVIYGCATQDHRLVVVAGRAGASWRRSLSAAGSGDHRRNVRADGRRSPRFSSAPATACRSAQRRKIFSWPAISASRPIRRSAWHSRCRAFSRR